MGCSFAASHPLKCMAVQLAEPYSAPCPTYNSRSPILPGRLSVRAATLTLTAERRRRHATPLQRSSSVSVELEHVFHQE